MARITVEEAYRGEKYGILGEVMKEYLSHGHPAEYDEKTWLEMLIVKHTLLTAERIKNEGDFVSGMTDAESLSCNEEERK